jgi:hypothetical protein
MIRALWMRNNTRCPVALSLAVLIGLICTIFAAAGVSAEPNKEQYELQERCGKRAEQMFKNDNPGESGGSIVTNTENGQSITTYQNHYSATLNKCFYLMITTGFNYRNNQQYNTTLMVFVDVNENKEYGSFFKRSDRPTYAQCNMQEKFCSSEREWQEFLRPYMEQ